MRELSSQVWAGHNETQVLGPSLDEPTERGDGPAGTGESQAPKAQLRRYKRTRRRSSSTEFSTPTTRRYAPRPRIAINAAAFSEDQSNRCLALRYGERLAEAGAVHHQDLHRAAPPFSAAP
ncbi:MAG: hypothetical protein JWO12_1149 [Frankiales bacterium]|nr:hypothetical protein [Frankiales bacterium]